MTLSSLMRGDQKVVNKLAECGRSEVLIPQPVVAEISYGLARLPTSKKKSALEERFREILSELGRATWTDAVSESFGAAKAHLERTGQRLEDFDIAIAAHALAMQATLVSSNARHLKRIPGLVLEDWSSQDSR